MRYRRLRGSADRAGVAGCRLVADLTGGLEFAIGDEAARMDDAFGNALAVEMRDLFKELVVLKRCRATRANSALALVVGDGVPLPVCERALVLPRSRAVVLHHRLPARSCASNVQCE